MELQRLINNQNDHFYLEPKQTNIPTALYTIIMANKYFVFLNLLLLTDACKSNPRISRATKSIMCVSQHWLWAWKSHSQFEHRPEKSTDVKLQTDAQITPYIINSKYIQILVQFSKDIFDVLSSFFFLILKRLTNCLIMYFLVALQER